MLCDKGAWEPHKASCVNSGCQQQETTPTIIPYSSHWGKDLRQAPHSTSEGGNPAQQHVHVVSSSSFDLSLAQLPRSTSNSKVQCAAGASPGTAGAEEVDLCLGQLGCRPCCDPGLQPSTPQMEEVCARQECTDAGALTKVSTDDIHLGITEGGQTCGAFEDRYVEEGDQPNFVRARLVEEQQAHVPVQKPTASQQGKLDAVASGTTWRQALGPSNAQLKLSHQIAKHDFFLQQQPLRSKGQKRVLLRSQARDGLLCRYQASDRTRNIKSMCGLSYNRVALAYLSEAALKLQKGDLGYQEELQLVTIHPAVKQGKAWLKEKVNYASLPEQFAALYPPAAYVPARKVSQYLQEPTRRPKEEQMECQMPQAEDTTQIEGHIHNSKAIGWQAIMQQSRLLGEATGVRLGILQYKQEDVRGGVQKSLEEVTWPVLQDAWQARVLTESGWGVSLPAKGMTERPLQESVGRVKEAGLGTQLFANQGAALDVPLSTGWACEAQQEALLGIGMSVAQHRSASEGSPCQSSQGVEDSAHRPDETTVGTWKVSAGLKLTGAPATVPGGTSVLGKRLREGEQTSQGEAGALEVAAMSGKQLMELIMQQQEPLHLQSQHNLSATATSGARKGFGYLPNTNAGDTHNGASQHQPPATDHCDHTIRPSALSLGQVGAQGEFGQGACHQKLPSTVTAPLLALSNYGEPGDALTQNVPLSQAHSMLQPLKVDAVDGQHVGRVGQPSGKTSHQLWVDQAHQGIRLSSKEAYVTALLADQQDCLAEGTQQMVESLWQHSHLLGEHSRPLVLQEIESSPSIIPVHASHRQSTGTLATALLQPATQRDDTHLQQCLHLPNSLQQAKPAAPTHALQEQLRKPKLLRNFVSAPMGVLYPASDKGPLLPSPPTDVVSMAALPPAHDPPLPAAPPPMPPPHMLHLSPDLPIDPQSSHLQQLSGSQQTLLGPAPVPEASLNPIPLLHSQLQNWHNVQAAALRLGISPIQLAQWVTLGSTLAAQQGSLAHPGILPPTVPTLPFGMQGGTALGLPAPHTGLFSARGALPLGMPLAQQLGAVQVGQALGVQPHAPMAPLLLGQLAAMGFLANAQALSQQQGLMAVLQHAAAAQPFTASAAPAPLPSDAFLSGLNAALGVQGVPDTLHTSKAVPSQKAARLWEGGQRGGHQPYSVPSADAGGVEREELLDTIKVHPSAAPPSAEKAQFQKRGGGGARVGNVDGKGRKQQGNTLRWRVNPTPGSAKTSLQEGQCAAGRKACEAGTAPEKEGVDVAHQVDHGLVHTTSITPPLEHWGGQDGASQPPPTGVAHQVTTQKVTPKQKAAKTAASAKAAKGRRAAKAAKQCSPDTPGVELVERQPAAGSKYSLRETIPKPRWAVKKSQAHQRTSEVAHLNTNDAPHDPTQGAQDKQEPGGTAAIGLGAAPERDSAKAWSDKVHFAILGKAQEAPAWVDAEQMADLARKLNSDSMQALQKNGKQGISSQPHVVWQWPPASGSQPPHIREVTGASSQQKLKFSPSKVGACATSDKPSHVQVALSTGAPEQGPSGDAAAQQPEKANLPYTELSMLQPFQPKASDQQAGSQEVTPQPFPAQADTVPDTGVTQVTGDRWVVTIASGVPHSAANTASVPGYWAQPTAAPGARATLNFKVVPAGKKRTPATSKGPEPGQPTQSALGLVGSRGAGRLVGEGAAAAPLLDADVSVQAVAADKEATLGEKPLQAVSQGQACMRAFYQPVLRVLNQASEVPRVLKNGKFGGAAKRRDGEGKPAQRFAGCVPPGEVSRNGMAQQPGVMSTAACKHDGGPPTISIEGGGRGQIQSANMLMQDGKLGGSQAAGPAAHDKAEGGAAGVSESLRARGGQCAVGGVVDEMQGSRQVGAGEDAGKGQLGKSMSVEATLPSAQGKGSRRGVAGAGEKPPPVGQSTLNLACDRSPAGEGAADGKAGSTYTCATSSGSPKPELRHINSIVIDTQLKFGSAAVRRGCDTVSTCNESPALDRQTPNHIVLTTLSELHCELHTSICSTPVQQLLQAPSTPAQQLHSGQSSPTSDRGAEVLIIHCSGSQGAAPQGSGGKDLPSIKKSQAAVVVENRNIKGHKAMTFTKAYGGIGKDLKVAAQQDLCVANQPHTTAMPLAPPCSLVSADARGGDVAVCKHSSHDMGETNEGQREAAKAGSKGAPAVDNEKSNAESQAQSVSERPWAHVMLKEAVQAGAIEQHSREKPSALATVAATTAPLPHANADFHGSQKYGVAVQGSSARGQLKSNAPLASQGLDAAFLLNGSFYPEEVVQSSGGVQVVGECAEFASTQSIVRACMKTEKASMRRTRAQVNMLQSRK